MFDDSLNKIVISLGALRHNYRQVASRVGPAVEVMAMVKADGYGHGMVEAATAFHQAGCRVFGVAELREAVRLRSTLSTGQIFVTLGVGRDQAELVPAHRLIPVIYSLESARALAAAGERCGESIGVHVKVDTGMGRLGILPEQLAGFCDHLDSLKGIRVAGIMSHFPEADVPDSPSTRFANARFRQLCAMVAARYGANCHIANSGGVLNFPESHGDMVRAGIALYGYHPGGTVGEPDPDLELQPAMSFATSILQVKELPAGSGISYGRTFITAGPTRIAVLPVGYEDGVARSLSGRLQVLIGGRRVPVRGRICMNMMMADVTGEFAVLAGDEAVIMGRQGDASITADDIAGLMDSISYEVLCLLGSNNQRVYQD